MQLDTYDRTRNQPHSNESSQLPIAHSSVATPRSRDTQSVDARFATKVTGHIPVLDGLRGIAILMVLFYRFRGDLIPADTIDASLFHVQQLGKRGVDLFFVLSGFLITGILWDAKAKPQSYFRNFYMRRTLRIFPLYYFALALFLILLPALATIPSGFQDAVVGKNWLWFYGTNIKMSFTNQWCFGAFDHFWSLAVEEHFYLIWPIVIYSLSRRSAIAVTVAGAAIISTARIAFACFSDPGVALDVATWFRADSLLCGSFFALLIRGHRGLEGALPLARTAIIFGAITSLPSILLPEERIKTIPHTTFALLFGGLLVELLNWQNHTAIRSLFTSRSLTTLGKLSYGMYVYQLPLLVLSAPWLTASSMSHWTSSALVARLGYLAIMSIATLACAYASWHLLEKHYLKLKDSFTASSRVSTELSKTTPAASPAIS